LTPAAAAAAAARFAAAAATADPSRLVLLLLLLVLLLLLLLPLPFQRQLEALAVCHAQLAPPTVLPTQQVLLGVAAPQAASQGQLTVRQAAQQPAGAGAAAAAVQGTAAL
jgi:hypothetical protein